MSYDRETNPFYTADEDEFGFGKSKSGYAGGSKDPFGGGSDMSKYERLQQLKENSMNNQLESTQRALASLHDSEAMGVATAEELVQQGEQLDNVENNLDKINQDMKTSQKHLNSIKSVFGGIKSWWRGEKTEDTSQVQKTKSAPSSKLQSALDESRETGEITKGPHPAFRIRSEDGRGFYEEDDLDSQFLRNSSVKRDQVDSRQNYSSARPSAQGGATSKSAQQPQMMRSGLAQHDVKLDENLDMMSSGMARLKGLALGMGSEIERQNDQVDRITGKADRADIKLNDQNRQMRQILR